MVDLVDNNLTPIFEENKRKFYLNETVNSKWSVRELQRQKGLVLV